MNHMQSPLLCYKFQRYTFTNLLEIKLLLLLQKKMDSNICAVIAYKTDKKIEFTFTIWQFWEHLRDLRINSVTSWRHNSHPIICSCVSMLHKKTFAKIIALTLYDIK